MEGINKMTSDEYKAAISDALSSAGNNYRLLNILNKKKDINIAFVGGSISQGWDGNEVIQTNYTKLIYSYLCNQYNDKNIHYTNLSTASANSFIGLSIVSKNTETSLPDIVFIEYAVNNECSQEHIISYESLVYRIINMPSHPAVILVFMINQSFYTSQGYMKKIGEHYGLPMISIADSLKNLITENKVKWTDYSDDWIHPNARGHQFIADCIRYYFEKLRNEQTDKEFLVDKPLYSMEFSEYMPVKSAAVITSEGFECINAGEFFDNSLSYKCDTENPFVKFEADFKNLFVSYMHDKSDRFSDADVYVDGQKAAVLQGKSIYGWGNVVLKRVYGLDQRRHHTVEVKVRDKKKEFVLAEFGIC